VEIVKRFSCLAGSEARANQKQRVKREGAWRSVSGPLCVATAQKPERGLGGKGPCARGLSGGMSSFDGQHWRRRHTALSGLSGREECADACLRGQ